MTKLKNDLFLRALMREPIERTPVWMMRQAGRYLPEYRATRAQAGDFMSLCRNDDLSCEVTLQPLRRYGFDAAILFSDILTVPDAMGLGLFFETGEGPRFERPIRTAADVRNLPEPDVSDSLGYVMRAVSRIRKSLEGSVPLIGFAGSPWTVATYMVEGGSSKTYSIIKALLYSEPEIADLLMEKIARVTTHYLNAQIEAGAQAVMVFDTWGSVLEPELYRRYSLASMQKIVDGLKREADGRRVPVVLFTKGAGTRLEIMSQSGCDGLGVDWTTDLAEARRLTGDRVALQGNMDPSLLYASDEAIRDGVARVLASYGKGPGHVFNLGHGIHPEIDPAKVGVMVDAVREFSPAYHDNG
ncbi:MAG: uroporphyrinogen decarboxylase [Pseudomonadota bacterium]